MQTLSKTINLEPPVCLGCRHPRHEHALGLWRCRECGCDYYTSDACRCIDRAGDNPACPIHGAQPEPEMPA